MRDPHEELEENAKQSWLELDQVIKYSDIEFLRNTCHP